MSSQVINRLQNTLVNTGEYNIGYTLLKVTSKPTYHRLLSGAKEPSQSILKSYALNLKKNGAEILKRLRFDTRRSQTVLSFRKGVVNNKKLRTTGVIRIVLLVNS